MASMSQRWCWTINNYTADDEADIAMYAAKCKYLVYGREEGSDGTLHFQGCSVGPQARLAGMKKELPRAHLEIMRGTVEEAANYCKKDGDYEEFGELVISHQESEKTRWAEALAAAKEGRMDDIPADIYIRSLPSLMKIAAMHQRVPASIDTLDNLWYYGPTGTGKSMLARSENPNYYIKLCNKWWDGYYGQNCVIIEELGPEHWMLAGHLKQWADHHPFSAEVKGGTVCIRPPKIIVTSNYTIEECFGEDPKVIEPLRRRFKTVHFGSDTSLLPKLK